MTTLQPGQDYWVLECDIPDALKDASVDLFVPSIGHYVAVEVRMQAVKGCDPAFRDTFPVCIRHNASECWTTEENALRAALAAAAGLQSGLVKRRAELERRLSELKSAAVEGKP